MKAIYVCSPFSPGKAVVGEMARKERFDMNRNFAAKICHDIIRTGVATAFAPHLYFPLLLDEGKEGDRDLGIANGNEIMSRFDEVWFVLPTWAPDMTKSRGMVSEYTISSKLRLHRVICPNRLSFEAALRNLVEHVRLRELFDEEVGGDLAEAQRVLGPGSEL